MPYRPTTGEHDGVLATGATADGGGGIPEGTLRSVTASLNDSQGPCLVHAEVRLQGKTRKSIAFADAEWVRSDADGPVDVFNWEGEVPIPFASKLRIQIRNDTGSSVNWRTSWAVQHE